MTSTIDQVDQTEAKNSTHKAEVVEVNFRKHENADSLSVTEVFGGYTYVGRNEDWAGVRKGIFILPDSLVDILRPEFAFLADSANSEGYARIKARRLRGVVSYGLMIPAPDDARVGEDWSDRLGILHYNPPEKHEQDRSNKLGLGAEDSSGPDVVAYKYDIEAFLRHHHGFVAGEPVYCHEKADGTSFRAVFWGDRMHCGSRTNWKKRFPTFDHVTVDGLVARGVPPEKAQEIAERVRSKPAQKNVYWDALERNPVVEQFCREHPGVVVYGEVAGNTNCIKYGFPEGNRLLVFDLLRDGRWVDAEEARAWTDDYDSFPWVPCLKEDGAATEDGRLLQAIPYSLDLVKRLAEGPTTIKEAKAGVIREGCVVRPKSERTEGRGWRLCLKCINPTFLEKYR